MRKVRFFLLLLGFCWFFGQTAFLYAQEYDDEDSDDAIGESDWDAYMTELYSRGDQTFTIALGVFFPTIFLDNKGNIVKEHNITPPVGGALGPLVYTHFLGAHFFLGIEASVNFAYTLGQNTVFLIPIGAQIGWQFLIGRFEIPISVMAGIAPQSYLGRTYVGAVVKPAAAVYFRFNPDWSFGLGTSWSWYPQRPADSTKDMDAHMVGVVLAARYHF